MNFERTHPLQPFWDVAAAPVQAQALEQALERGLFEILDRPTSAGDVASQLGLREAVVGPWLDLLWSLGLASHSAAPPGSCVQHFAASATTRRFFMKDAADYCGDAWLYRARFLRRFAEQMPAMLDESAGVNDAPVPTGSWAEAAQAQIDQEQRAVTVPAVMEAIELLETLPSVGRFLDLGGGPGHVGLALARALPGWNGAVSDLADTVAVARGNIAASGLEARVDAYACDLDTDAIAGRYDLIWCSSVLHFVANPEAALAKMFAALNPGGQLLIAHGEIASDPAHSARVLPFYAPMMLRRKFVPRPGEISGMMTAAGFDVRSLGRHDFPMAPATLYVGRRR